MYHIDVETAFLNEVLDEEVYVHQPSLFTDQNNKNKVLRLHKALYGLKQSSKKWNEKLTNILTALGFYQCKQDQCVFIFKNKNYWLILAVYVDDEIIITNSPELKQVLVTELQQLTIKDVTKVFSKHQSRFSRRVWIIKNLSDKLYYRVAKKI